MKKGILLLVLLLPIFNAAAQLPDAKDIINKSRELTLTGSMSSNLSLIITEKNGSVRKRSISIVTKSFPDGSEKRMIKFIEPADVRGTSLLVVDNENIADEMWIYLPALKKTRRIVSSEKGKNFMSSEFSNSDMSSPTISDFNYTHLPASGKENMWVIESKPVNSDKAEEYGYSRRVSWFRADTWQLVKNEFYNYDNQIFKIISVSSIEPLAEGRYIIKEMNARNLITGRSSEILFDKILTNTRIDDSVFSLQNLER